MLPTHMGPTKLAEFNDTCGNNIQPYRMLEKIIGKSFNQLNLYQHLFRGRKRAYHFVRISFKRIDKLLTK